jgi:hypothetical protein
MNNNEYIMSEFINSLCFASEQLIAENNLTLDERVIIVNNMQSMLQKRLEKGAKEYGTQVPILTEECLKVDRDNLMEGIEECVDGLVYTIAERIRATDTKNKEYHTYINRSISNLCYSLLNLGQARELQRKLKYEKKEA